MNRLRSKSLTNSAVGNKIYAAQGNSRYTYINACIQTDRQTDTDSMYSDEKGKLGLYFTPVVKQLMICERTFCLTPQSCYICTACTVACFITDFSLDGQSVKSSQYQSCTVLKLHALAIWTFSQSPFPLLEAQFNSDRLRSSANKRCPSWPQFYLYIQTASH